MIVLICSEKGGSGKTTLATNLAVASALRGKDTVLIDGDPQASATAWGDRRQRDAELFGPSVLAKTGNLNLLARDLAKRYDHVVIDAGGRDSTEMRSAMLAADVILIPCRPSQLDLDAVHRVEGYLADAVAMRPEPPLVAVVLSQVPTHPLNSETASARAYLDAESELAVLDTVVAERKAYRDAIIEGQSVIESDPKGKAADEIHALTAEVFDAS